MQRSFPIATGAAAALVTFFSIVALTVVGDHSKRSDKTLPLRTEAPRSASHFVGQVPGAIDPCNPPVLFPSNRGNIFPLKDMATSSTPTLAPPEPPELPPAGEVFTVRLEAELLQPRPPFTE